MIFVSTSEMHSFGSAMMAGLFRWAESLLDFAFIAFAIPALIFLCWAFLQLYLDLKRTDARHHHHPKSVAQGMPAAMSHFSSQPDQPSKPRIAA